MKVSELDTPCLLLDYDAMERNIATMAAFFASRAAKIRPHFKTPKSPEVARRQLEAGAIGITVAKLGEAEVLVDAGLGPILMANQVVGRQKIDRLMALLARGADITIAVESEFSVVRISIAIGTCRIRKCWMKRHFAAIFPCIRSKKKTKSAIG